MTTVLLEEGAGSAGVGKRPGVSDVQVGESHLRQHHYNEKECGQYAAVAAPLAATAARRHVLVGF